MRISEFMWLTFLILDFEERKIRADLQLTRTRNGKYYVEKIKTENGVRFICMTDEAKEALLNINASRQKPHKEMVVDVDITVTLNMYTYASNTKAANEMAQITAV